MLTRKYQIWILILAFALVGSACSSDDTAETPETTTSAAGSATTQGTPGETTTTAAEMVPVPDNPSEGVTSDEILIGWLGDETGPTASTQVPHSMGATAYFEYINGAGGVCDRDIEILTVDDAYSAEQTTIGFRRLEADEQVLALVGLNNSSGIDAVTGEVEEAKLPVVGSQSGSTTTHENEYFWNTIATYAEMSAVVLGVGEEELGGADLVIIPIALAVSSGEQWIEEVISNGNEMGAVVLDPIRIDSRIEDATAEAVTIKGMIEGDGANFIALHGTIRQFLVLMDALEAADIHLPIGAMTGMVNDVIYETGIAAQTENAWGVHSFTPASVETPGQQEMMAFVTGTRYEEFTGAIGFVQGWINGKIIVEAISRACDTGELSRASLQTALGTITAFDTGGQSGLIDFSRPGHNGGALVRPYVWDGTSLVPAGEFADYEAYLTP